jgi:hypothetical protein
LSKIQLPQPNHRNDFVAFGGGLDVNTPPVMIPPGFVRNAQNFEEDINGGYQTIMGYERFDGRPSPSAATFAQLAYSVAGTVAVGDTITGATSGATGKVIAITPTAFVLTRVTGTWAAENTTAGGATVSGPVTTGASTSALAAQYTALAADDYRADITAVPGTGRVLGVVYFKGTVYAFRNSAAPATDVSLHKSSTSGWTLVPLGVYVPYTVGSGAKPAIGATITQGGVSGVLTGITVESGSFGAGDAAGRLFFASTSGGNFAAGAFTAGIAATSGVQANVTIPNQNGRYEFTVTTFTGALTDQKIYGCDGANYGFEFDGTTYIPIHTGLSAALDKPTHVADRQNHLFFALDASIMNSAIGDPYNWQTTLGAAEIACRDVVTGLKVQPGGETSPAMAVYCRNRSYVLYGTSASDWQLTELGDETGAIPWSVQRIGQTYVLDDRGVTTLATTQRFGNFSEAVISNRVRSWLQARRALLTDSHVARDKQQYRLFFSDGSAAYWRIGSKQVSMMPMLFPNPVRCSWSSEVYAGGEEVIYFGSDNGFVYQMEKGTSFDGTTKDCFLELVFNNSKSYRGLKKYRRISFEMNGEGYSVFSASYDLSYGSTDYAQPDQISNTVDLATARWDEFVWDEFVWDGTPLTNLSLSTPGHGENIAVRIQVSGTYFSPALFSGAFIEYTPLRMLR